MPNPSVAAVLIVRNEARDLPRCLATLGWVDEIVVVDDHSEDDTVAIAEAHGCRVFSRRLDRFDTQRNWAMDQAESDWILSIDADELVSAALRDEIREVIARPDAAEVYGIPFRHRFFGRWVEHGGWPAPLTRLFRRHVRWSGAVHEQIDARYTRGTLRSPMLHYAHRDIAQFIDKLNRYTDREAAMRVEAGARFSAIKLLLAPLRDFGRRYLLEAGWRDGVVGLILAVLMAGYVFCARAKAWELSCPADEPPPEGLA